MALIDMVRDAAIELGLSRPVAAASSPDQEVQELVAAVQKAGDEMRLWHDWSALSVSWALSGDGLKSSFPLPPGFDRFSQMQTMLMASSGRPLVGPLSPDRVTALRAAFDLPAQTSQEQEVAEIIAAVQRVGVEMGLWQSWPSISVPFTLSGDGTTMTFTLPPGYSAASQIIVLTQDGAPVVGVIPEPDGPAASVVAAPTTYFYRRGSNIIVAPVIADGDEAIFEFQTKRWIRPASGDDKERFTADSDESLLDERIVTLGAVYRWKRMKRLDYAQEYENWRTQAQIAASHDSDLTGVQVGPAVADPEWPTMPDLIVARP